MSGAELIGVRRFCLETKKRRFRPHAVTNFAIPL
jgi:hypothetical protein